MKIIDIFLSINNREQVIKLPVLPENYEVSSPNNNEIFETINQGELKLIGLKGLQSLSIQSFFPAKEYSFNRDNAHKGYEYVEIIQSWIDRRVPIRLIITDTPINMAVSIEDFRYGQRDGSKDVYYTLELEEFRFIELRRK